MFKIISLKYLEMVNLNIKVYFRRWRLSVINKLKVGFWSILKVELLFKVRPLT